MVEQHLCLVSRAQCHLLILLKHRSVLVHIPLFLCAGAVGGSVWHFFKGARNAPKGMSHRLYGAFNGVVQRAPVLGGTCCGFCITLL